MTTAAPRTSAGSGIPLSRTTLVLHWAVAAAVLGMLAYGYWIQTLPSAQGRTADVQIHKSLGVLVFVLALARVLWRAREGFPPPAGPHGSAQRRAALGLHLFLIAATLLMPLSGIGRSLAYARPVSVFGWPLIPRLFEDRQETLYAISATLHDGLALVLSAGILVHVGAALKHHYLDRDDTLRRITGRGMTGEGGR